MGRKISKSIKKQILNIVFLLLLISVTLVILFLSNRELDFVSIGDFFARSRPWYIVAAFACMFGYIFFEALSLFIICRTLKHKCSPFSAFVYASADVYYSAITPSAAGGQPASAYYMSRDGMSGGAATFALILNIIGYTAAIIILGAAAFIINSAMFADFASFTKILIIVGAVIQLVLLAFFIACMFCSRAMLKCGNGIISLLGKIRIVKDIEKWRGKWSGAIERYRGSFSVIKKHGWLFPVVIFINVLQRASQILITCFVCKAVVADVPFIDIVVMQTYVTLGYNSIPLPGGVGAFEYIYLQVFTLRFDKAFLIVAMMVTRAISYYISLIFSGIATISYHYAIGRRKAKQIIEDTSAKTEEMPVSDEPPRKWLTAAKTTPTKVQRFIYRRYIGALFLRVATSRVVSKAMGKYLDSRFSRRHIKKFIKRHEIDITQFEKSDYLSFNSFFTRVIKPELRPFDFEPQSFVAPCDGLLSVYEVTPESTLFIKGFTYTIGTLLKNEELGNNYRGGFCFVFRLTVKDYHRYFYFDECDKEENVFIKGRLHTVQHVALNARKVFTENCREYSVMHTKNFGDVIQVEVGALGVGRIVNYHGVGHFNRGEEKGRFEYGGSTIIVITQKDKIELDTELLENTANGLETIVRCGERIGTAKEGML